MIKKLLAAGLSVIPITKGAKYPSVKWDVYQQRLATEQEADKWTAPIGIVGGKVSGGLICIDFDDKGSRFMDWVNLVQDSYPDLALSLVVQSTPSGGYHVIYRCPTVVMGNEKLARMAQPKDGKLELIETRGEGGQFLASPSEGYTVIQKSFFEIPILTKCEHDFLIACAMSFNERFEEKEIKQVTPFEYELSPFDSYDKNNSPVPLLVKHGWTVEHERGETVYMKRPGKKEKGISATWNHIPNRFYVFTTNTEFENEHVYKASAVFAVLEHGGNFKKAAGELINMGYGKKKPQLMQVKTQETISDNDIKTFADLERDWCALMDRKTMTTFGYDSLDNCAKQFSQGEVMTLAARSGVGKTTLGLSLLRNISKSESKKALFFSLEMSGEMVYQRGSMMFIGRNMSAGEKFSLAQDGVTDSIIQQIKETKIIREGINQEYKGVLVVDKPKVSLVSLAYYLERARVKYGHIDLVSIDYLGYLHDTESGSNYEKVSRIAKGCKEFAKEMQTRVILLCQTSRQGEDGTEPVKLHHLRDSGAIEESADYILGMWASHSQAGRIHCEMLKNRWHSRGSKFDLLNSNLDFKEVELLEEKKQKKQEDRF